jgi:syntaxin 1B/2/3
MAPLTQNGSSFGSQQDPHAIINECREISQSIDGVRQQFGSLKALQAHSLREADPSKTDKDLDAMASEIMPIYRNLAARIKAIKQQPESGSPQNAPQVGKVDRKLKTAITEYQEIDAAYQKKIKEQMERQYKIVRPEATEAEVRQAVENASGGQVFSQALLQNNRRGQATAAMNAVQSRHDAIQKIEKQIIELSQLFRDMDVLVVQQEAAVVNIEMKGEEVVDNMDKGTQEIGTAIKSARNARKWKWWCLGICGTFCLSSKPLG